MMKLFEHNTTREAVEHAPETHKDLPELPDDVEVPSDIRGLTHPEAHRHAGVRWMRWLAIAIPLMAGAIVVALLVRSDSSDPVVPDGYATAEANRMETLRDLSAAPALSTYELIGAPGDGTDFGPGLAD